MCMCACVCVCIYMTAVARSSEAIKTTTNKHNKHGDPKSRQQSNKPRERKPTIGEQTGNTAQDAQSQAAGQVIVMDNRGKGKGRTRARTEARAQHRSRSSAWRFRGRSGRCTCTRCASSWRSILSVDPARTTGATPHQLKGARPQGTQHRMTSPTDFPAPSDSRARE